MTVPKNQFNDTENSVHKNFREIALSLAQNHSLLPKDIVSIVENALIEVEKTQDYNLLCLLNLNFGNYWIFKQDYQKAKKYIQIALEIAMTTGDNSMISAARINLGVVCTNAGELNDALSHLIKALSISVVYSKKFYIYTAIAFIYTKREKYETALEYYEKAKEQVAYKTDLQFSGLYMNIGSLLCALKRYDEALENIHIAVDLFKNNPFHKEEMAFALEKLAEVEFAQKKYTESLAHIQQVIKFYEEVQNRESIIFSRLFMSKVYIALKQYDSAYNVLAKSLQTFTKNDYLDHYIKGLKLIVTVTKELKKLEECIDYQNELIEIKSEYFYPEKKEKIDILLNKKEEEIDVLMSKNQEIEKKNQQLQQYNKELEQYAFIIAHDLKEPLCNISGFTSLLKTQSKEQLDSNTIAFLQYIESGTQRMHLLLEDLLRYSTLHIDASKFKALHLPTLIQETFEKCKQSLPIQKAHLSIRGTLPALYADPIHLQSLFRQLIKNALIFSDSDRVSQIEIRTYEEDKKTFIEVKDNGIGIEKAHQQKIFRIFQRLKKENGNRTGIGLAMCKKIVELYDGEIHIKSDLGIGTRVCFCLPTGS